MSFYIKDLEIKKSVILAPMAGITSFSYRKFLSEFGVGATYSEMISDCGLIYNNKKTIEMMKNDSNFNRPYGIQLFGGSKESLLKGLEVIENSNIEYDFLDLNLKWPVPKVTKGNGGSKWLTKLDEMYEMVKAVVEKSKKPVTAKVRLGWKSVDIEKICVLLEKAGVSFIAIHARTKEELYSGKPHFEELKNIRDLIHIPFGVSGNIFSVNDALNALKITRADAVLIARGGIGNPNLIKNINLALANKEYDENVTFEEQKQYLYRFMEYLKEEKGEFTAVSLLKGLAPKFFNFNFPFIKELRSNLSQKISSYSDIYNRIREYEEKYLQTN